MKILILSQGTKHPEYILIDSFSKATWQQIELQDVKIFSFYGCRGLDDQPLDQFPNIPDNGEIFVDEKNKELIYGGRDYIQGFPEDPFLPWKKRRFYPDLDPRNERFINVLEYCLKNIEFDFIYRTSDSYYVDVQEVKNHVLNKLPSSSKIYTGNIFTPNLKNGVLIYRNFVAGSNILFSKDVVQVLVKQKELYLEISKTNPEDEAIGKVLVDEIKYIENLEEQKQWAPLCSFQETRLLKDISLKDAACVYKVYTSSNYNEIVRYVRIHDLITQKYSNEISSH